MKKIVLLLVLAVLGVSVLSGCTIEINGKNVFDSGPRDRGISFGGGTEITSEESGSIDLTGADSFEVNNDVGNISISQGNGSEIKVHAVKKVRGSKSSDKDAVMNNLMIALSKKDNIIEIRAVTKDKQSDFWKWKREEYRSVNVSIDYRVEIPSGLVNYEISSGVGDIGIDGLTGAFTIKSGTGNVLLNRIVMKEDSDIHIGAGNTDIDADINDAKSLRVNSGVGNVTLKLPDSSKFSLDATIGVGNISGSFMEGSNTIIGKKKMEFNGGGTKVDIKQGTGNITIDKK